jgi:hypothetical protein
MSKANARTYSEAFLRQVSQKRHLGLNVGRLRIVQELRGKDGDGQKVWKVDFMDPSDGSCARVLMRAVPGGRWFGRTVECF